MKKIKLFPAPNMEIRVYVTDAMEEDLKEHVRLAKIPGGPGKDCAACSWNDVKVGGTCMCELPEVWRQVLGEESYE